MQPDLTEQRGRLSRLKMTKELARRARKVPQVGAHETSHLATSNEVEAASRAYEFGDVLNPDAATTNAIARHGLQVPIELDYQTQRR